MTDHRDGGTPPTTDDAPSHGAVIESQLNGTYKVHLDAPFSIPCPVCSTGTESPNTLDRHLIPSVNTMAWVCLDCGFQSPFDGTVGGSSIEVV